VKSAKMMTPSPLKTHPKRRMGRCCRSDFSYSLGSADLDYPMSPSLKIHRLAWRLVSLRRREGRTMWCENVSPRH
jgi:hypothetical protein